MTFGGVAAFASAPLRRLLLVQLIVASTVAVSLVWCLNYAWVPGLEEAILQLPERSEIYDGKLNWPASAPTRLTESSHLGITVNTTGTAETGRSADVGLEFAATRLKLHSVLGYIDLPYPRGWVISVNRAEVEPWWGARKPFVLLLAGVAAVISLFIAWSFLAAVYTTPVRLFAFYLDRQTTGFGCWKLAAAALLPGAMFMTVAIFLYGLNHLSLIGLLLALPFHLILGWFYLLASPFHLPRLAASPAGPNPFVTTAASKKVNP